MRLTNKQLLDAYRQMVLSRTFEERCAELFRENYIRGSLHLSIGQEAVAVGAALALRQDDYLLTTYRGHGHALAKGISVRSAMAEMMGRSTGCCKGKGGSMHWTDVTHGIMPANAIVGANIPIGVGCALASKLDRLDRVTAVFFGDGAVNQGAFHEAMNLAAIWKAPVIMICENNLYSEMTPIAAMVSNEHLAERAAAYRIRAEIVDGNDVEAMYEAAQRAVDNARRGAGPTFLEAKTYRLSGHMVGDSEIYRTREEVEQWRLRDPLKLTRASLVERGVSREQIETEEQSAKFQVEDAIEFAMQSPWPDEQSVFEDLCAR
ncbi:MAG TPA: thiamine pyrophosphate-dependent dehydrogenase E1 component subunit alpha [Pyrinomonadaceae bacterium]|nr:thiamine pyrophosphate-dependent dehydrogenase E1 component subunit alpha [Pyrinomonadaceae bacterium]